MAYLSNFFKRIILFYLIFNDEDIEFNNDDREERELAY